MQRRDHHAGIVDTEQVAEQQHVVRADVGQLRLELFSVGTGFGVADLQDGTQQLGDDVKRYVLGNRLASRAEHLDTPGGGDRRHLPDEPALADPRGPAQSDAGAAESVEDLVEGAFEDGHLPSAADERRVGAPGQRVVRPDLEQPAHGHGPGQALYVENSASSRSTTSSTSLAVDSEIATPPGGATDSIRWAIPTASPIAVYARGSAPSRPGDDLTRVQADPDRDVDPVAAEWTASRRTSRCRFSAARHPRSAWSSRATGAPKTAMIPSPVNLSTVPPYR